MIVGVLVKSARKRKIVHTDYNSYNGNHKLQAFLETKTKKTNHFAKCLSLVYDVKSFFIRLLSYF